MELTKSELEDLILNRKLPYNVIGNMYNCTGSNVRKTAIRLGIQLPKRRAINPKETFNKGKTRKGITICPVCGIEFINYESKRTDCCSLKCANIQKHKLEYEKILKGDLSIMRATYSPRAFKVDILNEQDNKCAVCGMAPEWNNKPLVFILDHIDGNAANNSRENLRLICPNCDSQLDTYKRKNKNGARSYYRYHKYLQE